jgi:WD40 repeat protein
MADDGSGLTQGSWVAWLPDGKIVSGNGDGTVEVWDATNKGDIFNSLFT